jgi:hypothetical protein
MLARLIRRRSSVLQSTVRPFAACGIAAALVFGASSPAFAQAPTITSSAWLEPFVVVVGQNLTGTTSMTVGEDAAADVLVTNGGTTVTGRLAAPLQQGSYVLKLTTTSSAPSPVCLTPKPVSNWVCVAGGGWVPPSHPLAAGAPSSTSSSLTFVLTVDNGGRRLFASSLLLGPSGIPSYVPVYGSMGQPAFSAAAQRFSVGCSLSDVEVEVVDFISGAPVAMPLGASLSVGFAVSTDANVVLGCNVDSGVSACETPAETFAAIGPGNSVAFKITPTNVSGLAIARLSAKCQ